MFHYTWGTVFKDSFGRKIWEFDKRTYTDEVIQRQVCNQVASVIPSAHLHVMSMRTSSA